MRGGGGGCVTLRLQAAGAVIPGEQRVLLLSFFPPRETLWWEPGLVVPAVTVPAVRPSGPASLSVAWRASRHAAGPHFTAVCPASFLTEAAVCKD